MSKLLINKSQLIDRALLMKLIKLFINEQLIKANRTHTHIHDLYTIRYHSIFYIWRTRTDINF